jgi:hypothetical protein
MLRAQPDNRLSGCARYIFPRSFIFLTDTDARVEELKRANGVGMVCWRARPGVRLWERLDGQGSVLQRELKENTDGWFVGAARPLEVGESVSRRRTLRSMDGCSTRG